VIRLLAVLLPSFAAKWVEVYADNPFYFLVFAGVILVLLGVGTWMERTLRDEARLIWHQALKGEVPARRMSLVRAFRNSPRYQRFVQAFKWYFLPNWVVAPLTVAFLVGFCSRHTCKPRCRSWRMAHGCAGRHQPQPRR
jgi:hypothetical protein